MTITFEAELIKIGDRQIIILPLDSSEKIPTRGMSMVQGTLNEMSFKAPVEPDGKGSHWIEVSSSLSEKTGIAIHEKVTLNIEPLNKWVEPEIPEDIINAIKKENLINKWESLTTRARWDWLRWIRATANPETRKKRIEVTCSKLQKGDKNPCCFDRTRCTITDVSKSGVLLD
ncbi:MAG: YdeI/OmpD-associated family protein [Carnobacterium sp.]